MLFYKRHINEVRVMLFVLQTQQLLLLLVCRDASACALLGNTGIVVVIGGYDANPLTTLQNKTVTVFEVDPSANLVCPTRVDESNWISTTTASSHLARIWFAITVSGNRVTATRGDYNGGWSGLDLRFACAINGINLCGHRVNSSNWANDGAVRTVDANGYPTSALNTATTPEVLYLGEWYPVCGHYFWDNSDGAGTVCQQLGFASGKLTKTGAVYSKNAMHVGKCAVGEALTACTKGGNAWGVFDVVKNSNCRRGERVGIEVTCSGGSNWRTVSCATGVKQPPRVYVDMCPKHIARVCVRACVRPWRPLIINPPPPPLFFLGGRGWGWVFGLG